MKNLITAALIAITATSAQADMDRDIAYWDFVNANYDDAYSCVEGSFASVIKHGDRLTAKVAERSQRFTEDFEMHVESSARVFMARGYLAPADAKDWITNTLNCVVY